MVGEALARKYLNGQRSLLLNELIPYRSCTQIWKLIKRTIPHIKDQILKNPGNGKNTSIWNNRIMETAPLKRNHNLRDLQDWLEEKGISSLFSISEWDQNRWTAWKKPPLPNRLSAQSKELKALLYGSAPINKKSVWKNACLPKIKFFAWTLLKGKILIVENLRKKGIHGPFVCVLCQEEEESTQHLFLNCVIARQCWKQIISPLDLNIDSIEQLSPLNKNWTDSYPYAKKNKVAIMSVWKCLPSTLCWHIWLVRNKCIFKGKKPSSGSILAKTWAQIAEMVSAKGVPPTNQTSWQQVEKDWYNKVPMDGPVRNHIPKTIEQPRKSRGRWAILDQQGKTISTYEWGLGTLSNNRAEAYGLLMGSSILTKLQAKDPIIIGDSAIIIGAIEAGRDFKNQALNKIKQRINDNVNMLGKVVYKHVLRAHNQAANAFANKAVDRGVGTARENQDVYDKPIP
eukprot:PITA_20455